MVAIGYAAALAIAAALIVLRYVQYATHPQDVAAYGGMYAGGDLALEVFICGMFLVVTFFLMLVIRASETAYTIYAKVLLGVSLTMPVSVVVVALSAVIPSDGIFGWACLFRLFASPRDLWAGIEPVVRPFSAGKEIYALCAAGGERYVVGDGGFPVFFRPLRAFVNPAEISEQFHKNES